MMGVCFHGEVEGCKKCTGEALGDYHKALVRVRDLEKQLEIIPTLRACADDRARAHERADELTLEIHWLEQGLDVALETIAKLGGDSSALAPDIATLRQSEKRIVDWVIVNLGSGYSTDLHHLIHDLEVAERAVATIKVRR